MVRSKGNRNSLDSRSWRYIPKGLDPQDPEASPKWHTLNMNIYKFYNPPFHYLPFHCSLLYTPSPCSHLASRVVSSILLFFIPPSLTHIHRHSMARRSRSGGVSALSLLLPLYLALVLCAGLFGGQKVQADDSKEISGPVIVCSLCIRALLL
jgi:hypothetical protein